MRLQYRRFALTFVRTAVIVGIGSSFATSARADIIGGFQNSTWTQNNNPGPPATPGAPSSINDGANSLTITSNVGGTANSAYYNTAQTIAGGGFNGFTATFNYTVTATGGPAPADGFSFVIQNAGINAVGAGGSGLGYAGIGSSASVQFNIWPFNGGGLGTNYFTGGNVGSSNNPSYVSVNPVDLSSGDHIAVTLEYNPFTNRLSEQLTDSTAGTSFFKIFANVDLAAAVGGPSAFVGFTGGDGLGTSTQVFDHIEFDNNLTNAPNIPAPVPEPSTFIMCSIMLGAIGAARLCKRMAEV